jgi:hypothetical protein
MIIGVGTAPPRADSAARDPFVADALARNAEDASKISASQSPSRLFIGVHSQGSVA